VTRQLQGSDAPVRQVAELLGFSSPSAFGHWFRSQFGCTARHWRRGTQGGHSNKGPTKQA